MWLGLTVLDPLSTVKTLLSSNWDDSNTDNVTPQFFISSEQPLRIDYAIQTTALIIYEVSNITTPNDIGANFKKKNFSRVSIDIRTRKSRSHARNCLSEVERIVGANTNSPGGSYAQIVEDETSLQDFSKPGFFRYVFDIFLRSWSVTKG